MTQLLQNAAYGTVLILVAALLRKVLKERLIPGARLALWGVCLFRLLTPAAPESVLSLWGLSRLFEAPAPASVPASQLYIPPQAAPQPAPVISWETVLLATWLAVGAVLAVRYALSWSRTRRAVSCAVPLNSRDPRYALLPKCARLREGPIEGAPLTFGAVKPTVVLSPGLEGEELDCVLAHEGVHASRRDNLWHYVMAVALVVHWWNPAVWLMSRLLRRDIELSCDRAALKKLGEDRRADYAQALVSLATQGSDPDFCQTFGRKAVEERIRSIMKFKKTSVIGVIFSLALVLAVTAAFASEPKEPDDGSDSGYFEDNDGYFAEKVTSSSASSSLQFSVTTDEDGSVSSYTVDLDYLKKSLLEHVADGSMTEKDAAWYLAFAEQLLDKDGKAMVWSFQGDSGLEAVKQLGVCYQDENGNLVPVDPATVVSAFILSGGISPSDADLPTYVEEGEENLVVCQLLGEGRISYDGGKIEDYEVHLPTFDEDGNLVHDVYEVHLPTFDEDGNPVDNNIIGTRFYSYQIVTDSDAVSGGVVGGSLEDHGINGNGHH